MPADQAARLAELGVGESGCISRVRDQHPERLRYLADLGMVPGAQLAVIASAPFDGPLTVRIGEAVHPIDRRLAREIYIVRNALPEEQAREVQAGTA